MHERVSKSVKILVEEALDHAPKIAAPWRLCCAYPLMTHGYRNSAPYVPVYLHLSFGLTMHHIHSLVSDLSARYGSILPHNFSINYCIGTYDGNRDRRKVRTKDVDNCKRASYLARSIMIRFDAPYRWPTPRRQSCQSSYAWCVVIYVVDDRYMQYRAYTSIVSPLGA